MIMKTVAITGGIGSGKSVVSRLLRVEGYPVYDCDSQAKRIMDNDAEIQRQLQNAFGEDVVVDGVIHRQKLASVVFGNSENLRKLNAIVHPAVIADIKKWSVAEQKDLVFVETAILRESGMETLVDEVWVVDAPKISAWRGSWSATICLRRMLERESIAKMTTPNFLCLHRWLKIMEATLSLYRCKTY